MKHKYPILFLHIPKTAGITLHDILAREYSHERHKIFYTVDASEKLKKNWSLVRNRYQIFRGHFLFGLHKFIKGECTYITMLRNPIDRTVSGYNYIKIKTDHPFYHQMKSNGYSLYEFLDGKFVNNFDNICVRFLSGDNKLPFGEIDQSHFEKAKANLMDSKLFFGLTEQFEVSILHFKKELNWQKPFFIKQNAWPTEKSEIDQKTMSKIIECNSYDLQLYDFAKNVFEERIKKYGTSFKEDVEAFIRENDTYTALASSSKLMERVAKTINPD